MDRAERHPVTTTVGEWISALYEVCLEEYGDEELAELIAMTLVEERLLMEALRRAAPGEHAAAA